MPSSLTARSVEPDTFKFSVSFIVTRNMLSAEREGREEREREKGRERREEREREEGRGERGRQVKREGKREGEKRKLKVILPVLIFMYWLI